MKWLILCGLLIPMFGFAQPILKENLTPKQYFYYDFKHTKVRSQGYYYKDLLGTTTDEHGKWTYFDENGKVVEERNYYRGKLQGEVKTWYSNGKLKEIGYFKKGLQDSISKSWYENGKLKSEGNFSKGAPVGMWNEYYLTGEQKQREEYKDSVVLIWEYWAPDSAHTQLVTNGNGVYLTFFYHGC